MGNLVIDSSALLAMLLREADAALMEETIAGADQRLLSALNYMETGIVWDNRSANPPTNPEKLEQIISALNIEVITVDRHMAQAARAAYRRFGKGNHAAGLNLGDCFAYALAKEYNAPLLFKGEDFLQTDVAAAL